MLAVDSARKNLGHTRFTSPSWTGKQIRMSYLIFADSTHQRIRYLMLTHHIGKRLRTVLTI